MFTGIIHHSGVFKGFRLGKKEMAVEAPTIPAQIGTGESVNVSGVCLSLIRRENRILFFNLSQETLQRTTLGALRPGAALNLELPLSLSSFLSGHLLAGHIDFKAKVLRMAARKPGQRLALSLPREFRPYFIPKGSVAVNGVSLTIASLGPSSFEIELIPITLEKSNLTGLRTGDEVNVECDMIGKYVYNWITQGNR
jgi:riboflavin synthase